MSKLEQRQEILEALAKFNKPIKQIKAASAQGLESQCMRCKSKYDGMIKSKRMQDALIRGMA